jgi:hypothetical protein
MPPHKPLGEDEAGGISTVEGFLDLIGMSRERLLDQHVLAGVERRERPLHVQPVGKRDVNGLDVGIGQQPLVAPVGAL